MRKTIFSKVMLLTALAVMVGCVVHHVHKVRTSIPDMSQRSFPIIHGKVPVAVINSSNDDTDKVLWKGGNITIIANAKELTETTVKIVDKFFKDQKIKVDEKASKRLELSTQASCEHKGLSTVIVTVTLHVKTGSGLKRKYTGSDTFHNLYGSTATFENAIAECTEHMLADKDIVAYIEK